MPANWPPGAGSWRSWTPDSTTCTVSSPVSVVPARGSTRDAAMSRPSGQHSTLETRIPIQAKLRPAVFNPRRGPEHFVRGGPPSDRASPNDTLTTRRRRGNDEAPSESIPGGASPWSLDKLPYISAALDSHLVLGAAPLTQAPRGGSLRVQGLYHETCTDEVVPQQPPYGFRDLARLLGRAYCPIMTPSLWMTADPRCGASPPPVRAPRTVLPSKATTIRPDSLAVPAASCRPSTRSSTSA
uniref:Uncharacterized protein n=1 Tax=Rhodococcus sp. NS1 TaxID=402236 RepID=A0A097SPU3_9NOCA|nr:hypothetical protein LRS1606.102 [Rhodococcus sp. NS1]